MATTTRVLTASVNGTVYTSNLNGALEAIDTCHAGATAPTDEVSNGKFWLDTSVTPSVLKVRANAAWVVVGTGQSLTTSTDLSVNSIATGSGSAASPSHTFTSDTDTGMFSTGPNGLGFSTGGVQRMDIGSGGDLNLPAVSTETKQINVGNGRSGDGASLIDFVADGSTYTAYGLRIVRNAGANGGTQLDHRGTGNMVFTTNEAAGIVFQTDSTTRMTIGSGGAASFEGNILSGARVINSDGSAASPSYSFTNDGDTGMFSATANRLSFACGGAEVLRLENDQVMHDQFGTAAAPSFSWRADPDTGMYRFGANGIAFSTSGSDSFRITTTQVQVLGTLVLNGTDMTATAAELNHCDGVTSNIQTQLDALQTPATGAVGSYGLMRVFGLPGTVRSAGSTIAGSNLRFANVKGESGTTGQSGTWRLMGAVPNTSTEQETNTSLWLRVS